MREGRALCDRLLRRRLGRAGSQVRHFGREACYGLLGECLGQDESRLDEMEIRVGRAAITESNRKQELKCKK